MPSATIPGDDVHHYKDTGQQTVGKIEFSPQQRLEEKFAMRCDNARYVDGRVDALTETVERLENAMRTNIAELNHTVIDHGHRLDAMSAGSRAKAEVKPVYQWHGTGEPVEKNLDDLRERERASIVNLYKETVNRACELEETVKRDNAEIVRLRGVIADKNGEISQQYAKILELEAGQRPTMGTELERKLRDELEETNKERVRMTEQYHAMRKRVANQRKSIDDLHREKVALTSERDGWKGTHDTVERQLREERLSSANLRNSVTELHDQVGRNA